MRTISDELKASLERKTPVYKKTVEMYRRLWSAGAYVYDTAIDITDQVKEYSPIRWKFDSEAFNVWTLDNTALVFRNDRNQWKQGNTKGYFTSGYQIADSKITVKFGAQLADGTFEVLKSFTGYINTDPRYDSTGKTATITIYGGMAVFERTPAEPISTLVEDELLGEYDAGEGADNKIFTTANNGVGQTKEFEILRGTALGTATEIKPSIDYSASNQNTKALPLTITLVTDLTVGEKLWISYRYWYQERTLEWLATQIMPLTGTTSYSISPAVFTTSIENTWDLDDRAHWETCHRTNVDTSSAVGSASISDWDQRRIVGGGSWTIVGGVFTFLSVAAAEGNVVKMADDMTVGAWEFRAWASATPANYIYAWFMAEGEDGTTKRPLAGYGLRVSVSGGNVRLYRIGSGTSLINISHSPLSTDVYKVTRDASGNFEVFINNVSKGTTTDTTYSTSTGFVIETVPGVSDTNQYFADLNKYPTGAEDWVSSFSTINTAILLSPVKDTGVDITSYGLVTVTYTLNGGTVTVETYSSGTSDFSADNDPAGWVAITGGGQIVSVVKRYLKFRITLTGTTTPVVDRVLVRYYTSTTLIDLVNLTSMTCKQVLEELAKWPAYEIGMTPDETFIYRPRSTALPAVMELRSDINIEKLYNISPGIDRVKNRIVADFGIYRRIADASGDANPNSIDNYDVREYTVSSSQLLPPENANLAFAVAPSVLAYSKYARRRCQVDTMFLPQLELGDKVTVYYAEDTALRRWKYGDTDVVLGQADLEYYDEDELENRYNFWNVDMRIEGISLDPNTFKTTLDLTEIV